jgi:hypothetical protein
VLFAAREKLLQHKSPKNKGEQNSPAIVQSKQTQNREKQTTEQT